MKKKMYVFHRSATDNGTVAMLTDKEATTIYGWIENLPGEIEFWLVPAQRTTYKEIINATEAEVHDQLKKEPFLPLRPKEQEGSVEKLKRITPDQLGKKMVLKMRMELKLTDDQINAAFAEVMTAWQRGSHCHIHANPGAKPETRDYAEASDFAICVFRTDPKLVLGLEQYVAADMKKFVLFSSTHASMLVAMPGKEVYEAGMCDRKGRETVESWFRSRQAADRRACPRHLVATVPRNFLPVQTGRDRVPSSARCKMRATGKGDMADKTKWWLLHNLIVNASKQHPGWSAEQIAKSAGCGRRTAAVHLLTEFNHQLRQMVGRTGRIKLRTIRKSK